MIRNARVVALKILFFLQPQQILSTIFSPLSWVG